MDDFLELVGLFVVLYYIISVILWCVLDTDVELFLKEKIGVPISSLQGKVVWVTGASSGIGKDLAVHLAKHGVRLVLSARRKDVLDKVKVECLSMCAGKLKSEDVLVLEMDMLALEKHQECFDKVIKHFNRLDILVNNAGRSQRANWVDITLDVDRELFELDVFAVVNLSRIAVKYFETSNRRGHLAVTSSGAGLTSVPFSASYSGAKFAIHGYFESLRTEKRDVVDVTLFCPGPIATNFLQECFTEKKGEKFGVPVSVDDRRMTSERCGYVFAVALANQTHVSWCGKFPVSLLLYITCYYPNLKKLVGILLGNRMLKKIREGK